MDQIIAENNEIKEEVLKKVEVGQLINYTEFLKLYEPYKEKISEKDFAQILGINYSNYLRIKNRDSITKVFKIEYSNLTKEEMEKIKLEVLKKVKVGQLINYAEFLKLYEPYKEKISEKDFAQILGINYGNYMNIKTHGTKAKIFKKEYINISEEEKEKIKTEILKKVKVGQSVNYVEFLELYELYKEKISEKDFAQILGINYVNYKNIKNRGLRTKVFKIEYSNLIKEEKEQIKEEVLKKVKVGQLINYTEFLKLYEPYKEKMSEKDFAQILGINYGNYMHIKNEGTKAKIFKKEYMNISEEEKEQIKEEVLKKVKVEQLINYAEFLKLYEPYKEKITKIDFAQILGINYGNYMNIKNQGSRTKVFKIEYPNLTKEEKKKIKEEVLKKVKVGQLINYAEFLKLYKPYKEKITEIDFSSTLGISYSSYKNIKNQGTKAIINDNEEKIKNDRIKYLVRESRYYSLNELSEIAKKYEISLNELFQIVFNYKKDSYIADLIEIINLHGKIWIGNINCSKEFSNEYAQYMINTAIKISNMYCRKYKYYVVKEDIISDSIMYIIEKCGYVEKNYTDEKQIKQIIYNLIRKYIKNYFLWSNIKTYSIFGIDQDGEEVSVFDKGIKDDSINVEKEVVESMLHEEQKLLVDNSLEESCLKLLKKYLELGYRENQAIVEVSNLVGIDIKELLEMLKKYLIEKNQVKETSKGEYVLK